MDKCYYPGFDHAASQLSAFIFSFDVFIIGLKNKDIIQHRPEDPKDFLKWLREHKIRDISSDRY